MTDVAQLAAPWITYLTATLSALTVAVVSGLWSMARRQAQALHALEITLAIVGERQEQSERALAYRADMLLSQNRQMTEAVAHLEATVDTHLGWHDGRKKEAS